MSAALKNIPATEGARKAAPEVSRPVTDLRNEPASWAVVACDSRLLFHFSSSHRSRLNVRLYEWVCRSDLRRTERHAGTTFDTFDTSRNLLIRRNLAPAR